MKHYSNDQRKSAILKYYNKMNATRISLKTTDSILENWLNTVDVEPSECIPAQIMNTLKNVSVPSDLVKSWRGIEYLYDHRDITPTEPTEPAPAPAKDEPTTTDEPATEPTPATTTANNGDKLKALEMLSQLLSTPAVDIDTLKQLVKAEVEKTVMPITIKYEPIDGTAKEPKTLNKISHGKTASIVKILQSGLNVYLYGEAGTGKSQIAEDCASILDLDFYFSGKCTSEYDLLGFKNAQGEYVPTAFYEAFTNGGLFLFDEMDASNENALIKFNSALSQGYFDFPVGNVKKHKDFVCIATGNTAGKGANMRYNTRRKLDGSTLDRFAMVEISYDKNIEMAVSGGNSELVSFVHELRTSANNNDIDLIVSYRAINKITKLESIPDFTLAEVLSMAVFGNISVDDITILLDGLTSNNKYTVAMSELL